MHRILIPLTGLICFAAEAQTVINTIAGNGTAGYTGDNGKATAAELNQPGALAVDVSGNLYVVDNGNARIRMITPSGIISTVAGNGCCSYGGDGGPATSASLYNPSGVAVDNQGNIYIADTTNSVIRKVSGGVISTIAGKDGLGGYAGDGAAAAQSVLYEPQGVAVDSSGNVFIADTQNNVIRKISASSGNISTVAGTSTQPNQGFSGDNGKATAATLNQPTGVAVDGAGNIFIADRGNNRIREVSASNGNITTIAGNGIAGFSGDGGSATSAQIYGPTNIAFDASGNFYIAVAQSDVIREVSGGIISTIAGSHGVPGFYGDGGSPVPPSLSLLNHPSGVAVDSSGNIYIGDTGNNRVRQISTVTPSIKTGGVVPVYSTSTSVQPGEWISIYGSNLGPAASVTWNGNFPTQLGGTSVTIDSKPAYLWFVGAGQINLQVPDDVNIGQSVPVVVTVGNQSASASVTLAGAAPSFSLLDATHVAGIIVHPDGSYDIIGPTGNSLGYATVAARAGDNIELFGVGFGPTTPVVPSGQAFSGSAATTNAVTLSINNKNVTPGFAGLSSAGLYQINLMVPAGLGTGDVPLVATVAGLSTQTGIVISLQ